MQNEKASSQSANPSLHGHTHYFPFSALHFISWHSERASVRKELFSDQLGLGLKIFLDRSSNDEYSKDESTKPDWFPMLFAPAAVYRPRNPQSSDYCRCVEDHFETFVQVYEERFERPYGFSRPYLQKVREMGSPIKRPLSRGKTNPVRENLFSR